MLSSEECLLTPFEFLERFGSSPISHPSVYQETLLSFR